MKRQLLFLSLAAAALLAACSKESTATSEEGYAPRGEFVSVTLPMQMADAAATTKTNGAPAVFPEGFAVSFSEPTTATANANATAPATRTIAQDLTNVWVLQFNSSGANVSTTNMGTLAAGAHLTVPSLEVGTGYTIYVVANGEASGLTTSNPATLTAFESTMLHTTAVTDATKLPMSGKLTGVSVVNLGDGKGRLKLLDGSSEVTLKRIHAELTLTVDFGVTGYTLTSAELYNVPVGATYGWNSTTTTFPDNTVAANFGYTDPTKAGLASLAPTTSDTKITYKWFMGDNCRGEVAGLTTQPERNKTKAPAYATFARVTMTNSTTSTKKIYYDIYLGSGTLINFDVKRNHTYTQSAAIKGSADFQEALIDTDARVSGAGFPIYLTDSKADSPIVISPKSTESTANMIWGPSASIPTAQDTFNGKANTDILMTTNATAYLAAKHCRDLGAKYYLPSQAELMLMWIYQSAIPAADCPTSSYFWSSTESSSNTSTAWYVGFSSGSTSSSGKGGINYVRCVREL